MRLGTPKRKGTPVEGDCCDTPFGYINDRALILYGKHDGELHILPLTPEALRKLAAEIEARRDMIAASDKAA